VVGLAAVVGQADLPVVLDLLETVEVVGPGIVVVEIAAVALASVVALETVAVDLETVEVDPAFVAALGIVVAVLETAEAVLEIVAVVGTVED